MNNASLSVDENLGDPIMPPYERKFMFSLLLALQVPSLLCTAFIFCHFKWQQLQTQIYGFLLIVNGLITGVELPITLYFLFGGTIHFTSRCSGWIILNYSLVQLSIFLMAWTSIERYLFIYHTHLIKQHFVLLHYIPVGVLYVFSPLLYLGFVLVYPCQSNYDARLYICGGPCYSLDRAAGFYDWFGNGITMQLTILLVNITLIIRHLIQRHRMKRAIITADRRQQWRRSVKLVIQLLAIALIYFLAWIPYTVIVLILMFTYTDQLASILSAAFVYVPYLQSLFLPFVCILFIPEIKQKFFALSIFDCCVRIQLKHNRVQTIQSVPLQSTTQSRHGLQYP